MLNNEAINYYSFMQKYSENTESLLWGEFLRGDQNSLSKIYLNNVNVLFDFGCKFTSDHALVKDCIQEVFIAIIQTRKKLSDTQHVKGYLLKSLKRKIVRETNRKRNFDKVTQSDDYKFELELTHSESPESDDEILFSRRRRVNSAVESLTSKQKEALFLRFSLGLQHNEIAEILHLSPQSSRALLSRTIQKIRDAVGFNRGKVQQIISFLF